jgi:type 1 glutamine amidotransferase
LLKATSATALGLGLSSFPLGWTTAADDKKKRVLFFTRSQGFQHSVVNLNEGGKGGRKGETGKVAHAEQIVMDLSKQHGFEVDVTKDGRVFTPENIAKYDAFFFYTTGDLTVEKSQDGMPPMPKDGKAAFLKAIEEGKGFIGSHCASDTFHTPGDRPKNQPREKLDPYISMLGGEFIVHGAQQKSWMRVTSPNFPGVKEIKDFQMHEEWYALKNFAPNLHVILAQDGEGMKGKEYQRGLFPATWARMHGKGRVFYTSMGHREDVWTNESFQQILLGGIAWATGTASADVSPNIEKVTPKAMDLPA